MTDRLAEIKERYQDMLDLMESRRERGVPAGQSVPPTIPRDVSWLIEEVERLREVEKNWEEYYGRG